ncbi:MAG: zf-TFIIB domain-containing protein [Actinomycetota bacterium]
MQCPNDAATLVMSERSGIEIDYCPTCRGIWLDRGELDKLIERSEQPQTGYDQQPSQQQQPYDQQPPYGQQQHDPRAGSSDTVSKIADKVMRTVQERSGGQRDQRPQQRRGSRGGWLGDILG